MPTINKGWFKWIEEALILDYCVLNIGPEMLGKLWLGGIDGLAAYFMQPLSDDAYQRLLPTTQ
jgi:hypothetical protein